jgi:hypothetical protein
MMRESESTPGARATHGICREHETALLKQIAVLAHKRTQMGREPVFHCRPCGAGAISSSGNPRELNLTGS